MSLQLPIQKTLLAESIGNLLGSAGMIFAPETVLSYITTQSAPHPPPAAAQLLQMLGAVFVGLTTPMLLLVPNAAGHGAKREIVYRTLLAGEMYLIPLMLWQGLTRAEQSGSLTGTSLLMGAAVLTPFCASRPYALQAKSHWFVDDDAPTVGKKSS